MTLPPVCILAGGLGTRLGDKVLATPKPLLKVAGEPFLVHQLRLLSANGADRAVLCVGHLGEQIEKRMGREQSGVALDYSYDDPPGAGTLGAVRGALPLLGDRFLVLYGDTYLRIDYQGFAAEWGESGLPAAMSVLHNRDRLGSSNAVYREGRVVRYHKGAPDPEMEWIDYGLGGLERTALEAAGGGERDLAGLYSVLAARGQMFGYLATRRFYEIGTPEALAETDDFLRGAGHAGAAGEA
jgi:NDP-sugar pyrophosphorylase family protein